VDGCLLERDCQAIIEDFAADLEPFTAQGLSPAVTNIKAGDMVLFDTRTLHGGCSVEDPSGESGREPVNLGASNLLRAIYILGASPSALQTPEILAARRKTYELDLFWSPLLKHGAFVAQISEGKDLNDQFGPPPDRDAADGEQYPTGRAQVRRRGGGSQAAYRPVVEPIEIIGEVL
jgi:hypothetical protein